MILKGELLRSIGAQFATEKSGEMTPEIMKRKDESENNTQLWMLVMELTSNAVKNNTG